MPSDPRTLIGTDLQVPSSTVRVTVALSVDIDPDAWALAYGVEGTAALRRDVRAYVLNNVLASQAAEEGAVLEAELR